MPEELTYNEDGPLDILKDLNESQREAVEYCSGPLMILAGAGSGKTRVLTYKVVYLISKLGISPDAILAVTFTNKAAKEMKERVEKLLKESKVGRQPSVAYGLRPTDHGHLIPKWIGTFHSICNRILRREIWRIGYDPAFTIYDEGDQLGFIKNILRQMNIDDRIIAPGYIRFIIDQAKNKGVAPSSLLDPGVFYREKLEIILSSYQEGLKENNCLDFGDLITLTVEILENFPEVKRHYGQKWKYILVDEYQDTNPIQYKFLKLLSQSHRNLCVVGDEDQSIYKWRGADIKNILDFERDFPEVNIIKLEQNYRSTGNILKAAGAVVEKNLQRMGKNLWTLKPEGDLIGIFRGKDEEEEAQFLVQKIEEIKKEKEFPYRSFAVFYRTHAQSRIIEKYFTINSIPYTIIGGLRFWDRMEIKDVLAYLRVLANPADSISINRIINNPPRGIGKATLEKIQNISMGKGITFYQAIEEFCQQSSMRSYRNQKESLKDFIHLMNSLRQEINGMGLAELINRIIITTAYMEKLMLQREEERIENLGELIRAAKDFEMVEGKQSLSSFLNHISLLSNLDEEKGVKDGVQLLTLHGAKGLEFPVVFIVGMEEGLCPHYKEVNNPEGLEEERRLCYVGMTRAVDKLYLTSAPRDGFYSFGNLTKPSRFLQDIPRDMIGVMKLRGEEEQTQGKFKESTVDSDGISEFHPGIMVKHPDFGLGIIQAKEGKGDKEKITVDFLQWGVKKLMIKFASLTVVKDK